jgi:hypothetical protein
VNYLDTNLGKAVEDLLDYFDTSTSPYTMEALDEDGVTIIVKIPPHIEEAVERAYEELYGNSRDSNGDV